MENMAVMTGDVLDLNEYKTYGEYKAALDGELQKSAESFVRIGYLLKVARDTDILAESGYSSVNEFADKEYGLDKSQVSRFIRINDEFSKNGYSDRLQERYRSFGYSKLAIMLLLPAEINEELSSGYSKADIQAIREEIDEERQTSDIEVMLEEKDERQQDRSAFGKALYQLGKDNPEMYIGIYDAMCGAGSVIEEIMDMLAPEGEEIISVRIAGEGRKMLSIKGTAIDPVLVDVRSGEKQSCTWTELVNELKALCHNAENAQKAWEILYGEPFPEKEAEVAPAQLQKEQTSRKVSKVTKAKKPEKTGTESVQVEERSGVQEDQDEKAEQQNGQEAAGGENKEGGENETQAEACADGRQAEEHPAGSEPEDKKDGAVGGAGEDSTGGSTDSESGAEVAPVQPEDEQLEGQMDITDFPEYIPEKLEKTGAEAESPEAAGVEELGTEIRDADGLEQHIENQTKIILAELHVMRGQCVLHNWEILIKRAHKVIERAEAIKNMEEVFHG